jgi:hypothetical protein
MEKNETPLKKVIVTSRDEESDANKSVRPSRPKELPKVPTPPPPPGPPKKESS